MVMLYEGSALKHLAQVRPDYPTDVRPARDHGREEKGKFRQKAGRDSDGGRRREARRATANPDSAAAGPHPAPRTPHPGERSEPTPCGFCGQPFVEDRGQATCQACPLSKGCGLMRCPHCGYENAKEPGWLSRIKEWIG